MTELVRTERDGAIAILTINRPDTRNAISDVDMVDTLVAALTGVHADQSVRVVILTGAGSAFCAGGNLKTMGEPGELASGDPLEMRHGYAEGIQRIPRIFQTLDVPVIAAVNGPAIGAGCDLACMCDIRIAGESAVFAESFVKLGLIPGDGGAWLLQRVIGFSRAAEMSFTGEAIDAAGALAYGLVSQVVPDAELRGAALALARRIAVNPGHAVRMTKRLMIQARNASLDTVLDLSAAVQSLAHTTAEYREAMAAFREKRLPKFR
jgi:enoyl-CoA hydratase/carnithine racemase